MPIFITEAGFPDSGLQVWKLLEYGFLGYGNGNPWVMLEATFHGIVFAQLIYRTPQQMAGSMAHRVLGMDHDAIALLGYHLQGFDQPVRRAVVVAIQHPHRGRIRAIDPGVPGKPEITMLDLKDLVALAQDRMLPDDSPSRLRGAVEHRHQLHGNPMVRRKFTHALKTQQAPMRQHVFRMEIHD